MQSPVGTVPRVPGACWPAPPAARDAAGQRLRAGGTAPPQRPAELTGTFDFFVQNFAPSVAIHEQSIAGFKEVAPGLGSTSPPSRSTRWPPRPPPSRAASAGADGVHTYSDFWRDVDAPTVMLPLAQLMSRKEAEKLAVPTLLDSRLVQEAGGLPHPAGRGVNGSHYQYNVQHLEAAGIDPKRLTTLDDDRRGGGQAHPAHGLRRSPRPGCCPPRAPPPSTTGSSTRGQVLRREDHQVVVADRRGGARLPVPPRPLRPPPRRLAHGAVRAPPTPWGRAPPRRRSSGPYSISGLWQFTHMDGKIVDQPLPAFVNGKQPNYYLDGVLLHDPHGCPQAGQPQGQDRGAYYKLLFSAENRMQTQANDYSGAILNYEVYTQPEFKTTKFGAIAAPGVRGEGDQAHRDAQSGGVARRQRSGRRSSRPAVHHRRPGRAAAGAQTAENEVARSRGGARRRAPCPSPSSARVGQRHRL